MKEYEAITLLHSRDHDWKGFNVTIDDCGVYHNNSTFADNATGEEFTITFPSDSPVTEDMMSEWYDRSSWRSKNER